MADIEEVKKKSIKGVVSYGVRTAFLHVIAVIATGLLGIYLNPDEFGVYYIVLSVIGIFTFLSDIGLAAALVQKREEPTQDDLVTTFTVQQILALGILGLAIGLTPLWRAWMRLDEGGLYLLYALSFSFVLASLKTIPSILLERKLEFNKLVLPQIVEQVLFYLIAVYMAYQGHGVNSFTLAVLARSLGGVVVIYMLQKWRLGLGIKRKSFREMVRFGAKFQLNDLLARLKDDLFILILARFLPASQMGYLGWAKRWSIFPYQFSVHNVIAITFPTYARLQQEKQVLRRAIEKSLFFISLVIFPILTGMTIMAVPLTDLVAQYDKWKPAIPLLGYFCLNIAFAAMANPIINVLNAVGKVEKTLRIMILMTAATWIITPLGYMWWGLNGVAIVAALVAALSLIAIPMVKRIVEFEVGKQIWGQVAASGVMGIFLGVGMGWWRTSWLGFGIGILGGMMVYSLVIGLLIRGRLMRELRSLRVK